MPFYDFRCADCGSERQILTSYDRSRWIELICMECGGGMKVAPVLSINLGAFAATDAASEPAASAGSKGCGHAYACRCNAVKLTRPNPFAAKKSDAKAD
ncbi:MAG: hypothetical protein DI534_10725 [Leifsonia xyli]|nr:MAG: hypothetical protein DI534_10725 [Leifsonia xyli]